MITLKKRATQGAIVSWYKNTGQTLFLPQVADPAHIAKAICGTFLKIKETVSIVPSGMNYENAKAGHVLEKAL